MTEKILVECLVEKYGDNTILNDINVPINEGDVVCAIDPSGSGKSTFLRCLSQLGEASGGDIIIDGANLTGKDTDINQIRQHIGMAFQHFNLFPHLSILENIVLAPIDLGRLSKNEAEEKALELLEHVGLVDKEDAYSDSLFDGRERRVAFARTLAVNPDIMFFDEPTSALGPKTVGNVLGVTKDLVKQGMTVVMVTCEMGFIKEMVNRIMFIDGDSFLEDGSPEQVFENPRNPRMEDFSDEVLNI